jgi:hypothetical protein
MAARTVKTRSKDYVHQSRRSAWREQQLFHANVGFDHHPPTLSNLRVNLIAKLSGRICNGLEADGRETRADLRRQSNPFYFAVPAIDDRVGCLGRKQNRLKGFCLLCTSSTNFAAAPASVFAPQFGPRRGYFFGISK